MNSTLFVRPHDRETTVYSDKGTSECFASINKWVKLLKLNPVDIFIIKNICNTKKNLDA